MIQIRPRWPVTAAALVAFAYGANNYRIEGIDQLRLQERKQTEHDRSVAGNGRGIGNEVYSTLTGFWSNKLTLAEKLAMLGDSEQGAAVGLTPIPEAANLPSTSLPPALPVSTPIPFPSSSLPDDSAAVSPGLTASHLDATGLPGFGGSGYSAVPTSPSSGTPPASASEASEGTQTLEAQHQGIRIASFNASALGVKKLSQPLVAETLVKIFKEFDVIALQQIQSSRDDVLPMIIGKLNGAGGSYDYLIGPRVGRVSPTQQFAVIFDTTSIETDRYQLYTVDDPQDLISYEPLVAWFRCKGVPKAKAFTFSLIVYQVDAHFADAEMKILDRLVEAVRADGRNEDDWVLAGSSAGQAAVWSGLPSNAVRMAVYDQPTDVAGTGEFDNLLFSAAATQEYSGRSGVLDFLRKYNYSLEEASRVSPHLPVWAEFSRFEGAGPGLVAPVTQ